MMTRCSTPLIVASLVTTILADRASLDCPLRQIGLDYAQMVQPQWRPLAAFQELADALNGAAEAVDCHVKPSMRANKSTSTRRVKTFALPPTSAALVLFADAVRGSDADGDGSEAKPFASLHRGLAAVRTFRAGRDAASLTETDRAYLMLRAGTFYLGSSGAGTLHLGASDSFLTVQAYPEEDVTISGGTPLLGLQWEMVPEALPKRTVYEFRNGGLEEGFDAAPPEMLTVAEAQAKCSAMPTCAAFTFITSVSPPGVEKVKVSFKHEVFWNPTAAGSTYVRNVGYEPTAERNLYRADVSSVGLQRPIDSLRVGGQRAILARYPNVKTVEQLGAMQIKALHWVPQSALNLTKTANYTFEPAAPGGAHRNDTAENFFQSFKLGVGGDCAMRFTPKASYWCSKDSQGGGPGPYSAPVGMVVTNSNESLPHTPYGSGAGWASAGSGALVHTWRDGRWFSWVMKTKTMEGRFDAGPGTTTFDFSLEVGGNQGSRGGDAGQEFFVENVFDELDSPGEFYYDPSAPLTGKPMLWLWHNASGAPPDGQLIAPQLVSIINASGTQAAPVVGIGFRGLIFRDAAPAFLEPHGTPSGGDWAVSRTAALLFEGTVGTEVAGCLLTSLDGHAVFLSGYNRGAAIGENEFVSIGETAISQWGYTDGSPVPGMGFDATAGNQPRGTLVISNLVHEVGIFTKQNSFYFQSESFNNTIADNVAYNGPRAGINFDDGLGGGSLVTRNVLANFCRESSDHGPFNSWDRQVYVYDDAANGGAPTVQKKNDTISFNFILANYHSSMAIDNDDGSAYYDTHDNVFISASSGADYGGDSLKSDFGGHSNFHHANVDLFWSKGFGICDQAFGYADGYYDNYLYLSSDGSYGNGQQCTGGAKTIVGGNTIWSPTGKITECGKDLADWQAEGNDVGTKALPYPADAEVLAIVRQTLKM